MDACVASGRSSFLLDWNAAKRVKIGKEGIGRAVVSTISIGD